MTISTDLNSDFLSLDEKERYKKHLTLNEIGLKGQLKPVSYTHLTLPTNREV